MIIAVFDRLYGRKDRLELMCSSEISGIAYDEIVPEFPFGAQWIIAPRDRRDGFAIGPIVTHAEAFRRYVRLPKTFGHQHANGDIHVGLAQRNISQLAKSTEQDSAQFAARIERVGDFRKKVL